MSHAQGYVLQSRATHRRFVPGPSSHAFSYPVLSYLVSLRPLESGKLDIEPLFKFGITTRFTGLRASQFLHDNSGNARLDRSRSILKKLEDVLLRQGYDVRLLADVWMMAMPSYFAFEGINPLTVYYCYQRDGDSKRRQTLWFVVLEVHNTFSERHVYTLEVGRAEWEKPKRGYDHSWTFPRAFHVSPFNDRSGTYDCSVVAPEPDANGVLTNAVPVVRVDLRTPDGQLKLTAVLRAERADPFSRASLLKAISKQPFDLFLTFLRILREAAVLHYKKHLPVYPCPPPKTRTRPNNTDTTRPTPLLESSGIGWRAESYIERYSRHLLERFLQGRAAEMNLNVVLEYAHPAIAPKRFGSDSGDAPTLELFFVSPEGYMAFLTATTPALAYAYGSFESKLVISDFKLFEAVFATDHLTEAVNPLRGVLYGLRKGFLSPAKTLDADRKRAQNTVHPLDLSIAVSLINAGVLIVLLISDYLQRGFFSAIGAKFIPGTEPWLAWSRVLNTRRRE